MLHRLPVFSYISFCFDQFLIAIPSGAATGGFWGLRPPPTEPQMTSYLLLFLIFISKCYKIRPEPFRSARYFVIDNLVL